MRSIAIPSQVYIDCGKEINAWLQENEAVTRDSIIHPVSNFYNPNPKIVFTFEDPYLAMLFRLIWG